MHIPSIPSLSLTPSLQKRGSINYPIFLFPSLYPILPFHLISLDLEHPFPFTSSTYPPILTYTHILTSPKHTYITKTKSNRQPPNKHLLLTHLPSPLLSSLTPHTHRKKEERKSVPFLTSSATRKGLLPSINMHLKLRCWRRPRVSQCLVVMAVLSPGFCVSGLNVAPEAFTEQRPRNCAPEGGEGE